MRTRIRHPSFREFGDEEIEQALAYVQKKYRIELDFNHLRKLANEVGKRRDPNVIFPMFVGDVARDGFLRERDIREAAVFEAYRGATCKLFSDRSAKKRSAEAKSRRENREVHSVTKAEPLKYPLNAKTGQYRML